MNKVVIVIIGGLALVMALAGPAAAYECYNASRSDTGNARVAANSQGLWTAERILGEGFGLCPAGVTHVIDGLHAANFDTSFTINPRTLMAGGLERGNTKNPNAATLLHDGKGIDHLSEEFFAVADPLVEEAFGICASA